MFELVYCYLFIVETKGRSLEETAALFDGDDAVEQITNAHAHDLDEKGSYSPANSIPKV